MLPRSLRRASHCLTLALVFTLPSLGRAQDCDDKTKVLSEAWFMTKLDCGADKLVESGTSAVSELGMKVAAAALDAYAPGIASILFGEEDPFAAHFAELKVFMEQQADRIINELLKERRRRDTLELISVMNAMRDFMDDPIHSRAVKVDSVFQVDQVLDRLSIDLRFPLEADLAHLNFGIDYQKLSPPDVDRYHSLLMVSALRGQVIPLLATAEAYASNVRENFSDPSREQLLVVDAEATEESMNDLTNLVGDLQLYLTELSNKDLFRARSDQRFSQLIGVKACGLTAYTYSKNAVGQEPTAAGSERWQYFFTDEGVQGTPPSCFGTATNRGPVTIVNPDGTRTSAGIMTGSQFLFAVNTAYNVDKLTSYRSFLMGSYGATRGTLTNWYRQLGWLDPTELRIDVALRDALRQNTNIAAVLDGIHTVALEPLTPLDVRAAEDLILQAGWQYLYVYEIAASFDYLNVGRGQPTRDVVRFLRREAGPEIIVDMATAKFDAIAPPF